MLVDLLMAEIFGSLEHKDNEIVFLSLSFPPSLTYNSSKES